MTQFAISEFTLNSILLRLVRDKKFDAARRFIADFFERGNLNLFRLVPTDFNALKEVFETFNLDYDDSYQYLVCKKNDLAVVTYDSDFKHVDIKVLTPEEILHPPTGSAVPITEG